MRRHLQPFALPEHALHHLRLSLHGVKIVDGAAADVHDLAVGAHVHALECALLVARD